MSTGSHSNRVMVSPDRAIVVVSFRCTLHSNAEFELVRHLNQSLVALADMQHAILDIAEFLFVRGPRAGEAATQGAPFHPTLPRTRAQRHGSRQRGVHGRLYNIVGLAALGK
jgi:hypothetical protein